MPSLRAPFALRSLWALVIATLSVLLAASPAFAAGPDFFGTNIQPMVKLAVVAPERWGQYIDRQAADGLRRARADGAWAWAEPTAPSGGVHTYTWDPADRPQQSLDRVVTLLAARGVRFVAAITTEPTWARGSGTRIAPEHQQDYVAFAAAFAARYGSNGTFWTEHPELPRTPVTDYEIWTEANTANYWSGKADAPEYARVLVAVAAAVRAQDPGARILASIGWPSFESYTKALYASGVKGSIDGIAFHPYAPTAPAIIDLVVRMRRTLREVGDGALPIDVTEIGQPRAPSGAGSAHAGEGFVSDAARAATHSLTGEALAHADCGVTDYLLYANVGSETSKEAISEGYMGIYRVDEPAPNATGAAIAAAASRLKERPATGLALCSGGTSAAESLLPLGLSVSREAGCAATTTTYRGNPIEGAKVTLTAGAEAAAGESDAFGAARPCLTGTAAVGSFDVHAAIAGVARSAVLRCASATSGCIEVAPAGSGGGASPPEPTATATPCDYRLTASLLARGRRTARLRARLTCTGTTSRARLRFSVRLRRRGSRRTGTVRAVTLRPGTTTRFTLRARLRPGDRVMLVHPRNRRSGVPTVTRTVTVRAARRAAQP